jgi:transcriptional regulator with GAF, ATPase, and Fis domain
MNQLELAKQDNITPDPNNLELIDSLREEICRSAFWSVFGFGGAALWLVLLFYYSQRNLPILATFILIFVALAIVASSPKVPYNSRAGSIVIFLCLAGIACLIPNQLIAATSLFFFASIVLAGMMLGKRAVLGFGMLLILLFFLASFLTNSIVVTPGQLPDWTRQITPVLPVVIYGLIAVSALVPLTQYFHKIGSILELERQFSRDNQALNQRLVDLSNDLNRVLETQQIRHDNLCEFTKMSNVNKPLSEIIIDALSKFHDVYGYMQLEVFIETDADTYCHAYLGYTAESAAEHVLDTVQISSMPEIVRETMHASRVVVVTQGDSTIDSENNSPANISHLWQVCVPLSFNQRVMGALLIKGIPGDEIKTIDRSELELIANILALKVAIHQLAGEDTLHPDQYQGSNKFIHQLSQANSIEEISSIVDETLSKSPFTTFYFHAEKNKLHLISFHDPENPGRAQFEKLTISIDSDEGIIINSPVLLRHINTHTKIPAELLASLQKINTVSAAFLTIQPNSQVSRLLVLASRDETKLTAFSIQPYALLAGYATTAIEKVITSQHLQRRLIALQSLATISQAISGVTELDELFDSIHEQITKVVGDVDLAIALYDPKTDMISIPYAQEADQKIALEPFPLGQGLTSILIRTQQPLLLVEDTERRARELGAKITGAPAKSWLGVPLIVSGEVLGAILLQDIEHEQRFNEDDLRLITTLASQVAITIRNARLLQESNLRAERERIVSDITSKIWSSPNVDSIARNALQELSRSLQVSEGSIFLTSADNSEILRRQLGIREN